MTVEHQQKVLSQPRMHQVGRFWSVEKMHEKPLNRLSNIHQWFSDGRISTLLMPLTRQVDKLSLRALDWLVTNFAKKNNIVLADEKTLGPPINVYADYRSLLSYWRRKNFDPFRRHQRIYFLWKDPDTPKDDPPVLEETTAGQLNFLYWAETRGIIQYARAHVNEIEQDMAKCMCEVKALKKQDKLKGVKRKRHELSRAPTRSCFIYPIKMQVQFDQQNNKSE
jgi:hypothetical protein